MSIRPIKTWSYPGALLDALVDTRRVVGALSLPLPIEGAERAAEVREQLLDQLDHHLIPRVREEASPAIVVVGGSTGAGKSTVVNAILGQTLTPAGVLRPTTRVPYLFHHPLDQQVLGEVARKASVVATEAVPRGLAIVDSPDIDSVRDENREIAAELLEAADLWVFVTTAARYGDAVPWEALRSGADRGASIAIVLNRVTPDVAAQVRADLVARLRTEGLESLPLFVIPEDSDASGQLPRDVVSGLHRWLDTVAAASASTIIERTLHGSIESTKEWLELLAEHIDEQSAAAREVRSEVRRSAAQAEAELADDWYTDIAVGPLATRWAHATEAGAPLFRIGSGAWNKRRTAREDREKVLDVIRRDLLEAVEGAFAYGASRVAGRVQEVLAAGGGRSGPWLAEQRDPREARVSRERAAADAARTWLTACQDLAMGLSTGKNAAAVVGEVELGTTLASAALGVPQARQVATVLLGLGLQDTIEQARAALAESRRYCINREALETMKPTDALSLAQDASASIRLRRAELRGLQ